ncbi:MAG: hypothetical protein C7B45_01100 [Sulfobacillus acidophilus]|uniref:Uncharacterized protein n=1 Tax=Sulfobacillus acidophilus TaxID=53633 RepID=A0A2T2WNV7_9FIRM|nr:MAG: hypothetical protein C7B45_01100 [Sulfobacillus acidophilus]
MDGTPIDGLKDLVRSLNFDAGQILLPTQQLLNPLFDVLPAIAVVRLANGMTALCGDLVPLRSIPVDYGSDHRQALGFGNMVSKPALGAPGFRPHTAWVSPAVTLWNRSLRDNILYGSDYAATEFQPDMQALLARAHLIDLVCALKPGLDTEDKALLFGGEGQ